MLATRALHSRQIIAGLPYRVARGRSITDGLVGCWIFNGARDPALDLCGFNNLTRVGNPILGTFQGLPCMISGAADTGYRNADMKYPGIGSANRALYVRGFSLPGSPSAYSAVAALNHNGGGGIPYVKANLSRHNTTATSLLYQVDQGGLQTDAIANAAIPWQVNSHVVSRTGYSNNQRAQFLRGRTVASQTGLGGETAPTTYQFCIGVPTSGTGYSTLFGFHIVGLWNRPLSPGEALLLEQEPFVLVEPEFDPFDASTFYLGSTPTAPEITVTGNGNAITDGDGTPSATDHTDFGTTPEGTTKSRTFTIANDGDANLTISSVALSGTDAAEFTITTDPTGTIAPAGTGTLVVRADAANQGTFTATVTINSNDANEAAFDFAIAVEVTAPAAESDSGGGVLFGTLGSVSLSPRRRRLRSKGKGYF